MTIGAEVFAGFSSDRSTSDPRVLDFLTLNLRQKLALNSRLPPVKEAAANARTAQELGWMGVWDVLPFELGGDDSYTKHPHLGVWLKQQEVVIQVVLPNDAGEYWTEMARVSRGALLGVLRSVHQLLPSRRALQHGIEEPRLLIDLVQRHFHARRWAINDGRVQFDLNVLLGSVKSGVKENSMWLDALLALIGTKRKANMQLELMVAYPLVEDSVTHTPKFVEEAFHAAEALSPFVDLLIGRASVEA